MTGTKLNGKDEMVEIGSPEYRIQYAVGATMILLYKAYLSCLYTLKPVLSTFKDGVSLNFKKCTQALKR